MLTAMHFVHMPHQSFLLDRYQVNFEPIKNHNCDLNLVLVTLGLVHTRKYLLAHYLNNRPSEFSVQLHRLLPLH